MPDKQVSFSDLCHFTPKQLAATKAADEYKYTLFGGSAGPGKSYWLRWNSIRQLIKWGIEYNLRGIQGALFCEDYTTLKDRQVSKINAEFPQWLGKVKDTQTNGLGFHLNPQYGGHILLLRNLDDPSKYLSSEFALVAMEEVTQSSEETFHKLRSRMRWTGIPEPKWFGATNPGGIGHEWVKKYFIDRNFPDNEEEADMFTYVPALPTDNPHLAESYIRSLKSLPDKMRKAFLEGSWDVFEGQFFSEFDRKIHVVKPFEIPEHWIRLRSIDPSGRNGVTSCHWYALSSDGRVYVYREYYESGRDSDEHAKEIARLSEGEHYPYTCIDAAAFNKLGLPETTEEIYIRNGVDGLIPSMKNRVMGWDIVHQFLKTVDKDGNDVEPKLQIFENCIHLIRTIPLAIHDDKNPLDVKSVYNGPEHQDALDDLRYLLQTIRDQVAPEELNAAQKRLAKLKQQHDGFGYTYSRRRT